MGTWKEYVYITLDSSKRVIHREDRQSFYDKMYPEMLSVKENDNDLGFYEIDGCDIYDPMKVWFKDDKIHNSIVEFNKMKNREESIEEVLK